MSAIKQIIKETTATIGSLINGSTEKTTPVDADMVPLMDSAASNIVKKLSWSNIKSVIKIYLDSYYEPITTTKAITYADSTANLDEDLDSSETDVDVTDGTQFTIDDIIQIDSELMLITGINSDELTVIRGYAGSTAAAHTIGADIYVAGYHIQDDDQYSDYECDTTSGDVYLTFPSYSSYTGCPFHVWNESGTNYAICVPDGTEKINDYNANVEITENKGWWRFVPGGAEWKGGTDGWSTIYEVSTETPDTGLSTTSNVWDDVNSMTIDFTAGLCGLFKIEGFFNHTYGSANSYVFRGYAGLGTISGNNTPNIKIGRLNGIELSSPYTYMREYAVDRFLEAEFDSDGTDIIYLKARALTSAASLSYNTAYGTTTSPMYLRARRIA